MFVVSASTHMPIIDEYAKVMFKDFVITVPTDDLKCQKDLSAKLSMTFFINDNFKIYASGLFTLIKDAIVLQGGYINSEDTLWISNFYYKIASNKNIPWAYTFGQSAGINFTQYFKQSEDVFLKLTASLSNNWGYNLTDSTTLPNISPNFGNASVIFQYRKFSAKTTFIFNGKKSLNQLSEYGEDYIEKASSQGFLAWNIVNFRVNFEISTMLKLSAGVDNIFDKFYIPYASSIAEPGRNFVFSAKFVIK
jgi:hemoglobin/transferrin/lactoferrin receptor protein